MPKLCQEALNPQVLISGCLLYALPHGWLQLYAHIISVYPMSQIYGMFYERNKKNDNLFHLHC